HAQKRYMRTSENVRKEQPRVRLKQSAVQSQSVIRFTSMSQKHPSRREILFGMAAAPFASGGPAAQNDAGAICFMSAVEMARMIRTKKLSAREALAAHLKQIERVNPKVNAIVTLVAEMASDAAAKADEMQAHNSALGPLHGLPVAHKDLLE